MGKILIATNNKGKAKEFSAILSELGKVDVVMPADIGLNLSVEETGSSFDENAALKATAFAEKSGLIVVADDSGLEVDALNGMPGIFSARYAGPGASEAACRARLLEALRSVPPPRSARFVCTVAVASPGVQPRLFHGVCPGEIILEERGTGGFGYDPIFLVPAYGCTMAEMPAALKNQISHRGRALRAAWPYLATLLGEQA